MAENTPPSVRLHLTPNPTQSVIEIDGHGVKSCRGLRLRADVHSIPELELDLLVREHMEVDGQMRVVIPADTREILIRLGWTPPEMLPALLAQPVATPAATS